MTRMIMDGLTAALLAPGLAQEGWTLSDLGTSLRTALEGRYSRIHLSQLKRDAMSAEFIVGIGASDIQLMAPGCDAFTPPERCSPLRGVLAMWGSLLKIDDRFELRPSAIRCHANVLAMPSRHTGRFLVTEHDIPETLRLGVVGRPLSDIIGVDTINPSDFIVKSVRSADDNDFKRVILDDAERIKMLMGTAPAQKRTGMVIAVEAGQVITVDIK